MKKMSWWAWLAIGIVVLGLAGGGFLWMENARAVAMGSVSPVQGSYVTSKQVDVSCSLPGYEPGRGTVSLTIDGKAVVASSLTLSSDLVKAGITLADGQHTAVVDYSSSNPFSRRLTQSWTFKVDTTAPYVEVALPSPAGILGSQPSPFQAYFSEAVRSAVLSVDGVTVPLSLQAESARGHLDVGEGTHKFALTVTDLAGNTTVKRWEALAEFGTPDIKPTSWSSDTWEKSAASLVFTVGDSYPDKLTVTASLDDEPVVIQPMAGRMVTASPVVGSSSQDYQLSVGALPEGRHTLEVQAQNVGGHEATWHQSFLVNTTEVFGNAEMVTGAEGQDVSELQKILSAKGLYAGSPSGLFDSSTAQAVAAFRQSQGLSPEPVVDRTTLSLLLGSIVIDRGKRKLYLYEGEKLVKTYSVAVGQSQYPTPTGNFVIISKVVNPTWTPPDSPWAVGAKPIGPGPDDPLGTRWMGLSAPGVGIHGTNEPWSIGSDASHGCIRMHIPDAEDLFTRVFVGTPVSIVD